ncbi:uncharacterized protein LOC5517078 isoform X2 [Nematostella vectensis]|nr:uncharacterized protein LOC5517078 isoform X2 [Nematostella vectensis]
MWFATNADDGLITRELIREGFVEESDSGLQKATYTVNIFTGNVWGAGTDANILLTLYGTEGESDEFQIENEGQATFETGMIDTYKFECSYLGDLVKLRIGHDNTGWGPGWYLDKVTVDDSKSGDTAFFPCGKWFATDSDDGLITRVLTREGGPASTVIIDTENVKAGPLGLESHSIPDDHITASSHAPPTPPFNARLNNSVAWCAGDSYDCWLQVDLGGTHCVTSVATQGNPSGNNDYVKKYRLQYSLDGETWVTHEENGNQIFDANEDHDSVKTVSLQQPIVGRFVRFCPVEWYCWPCLRVELYGVLVLGDNVEIKTVTHIIEKISVENEAIVENQPVRQDDTDKQDKQEKENKQVEEEQQDEPVKQDEQENRDEPVEQNEQEKQEKALDAVQNIINEELRMAAAEERKKEIENKKKEIDDEMRKLEEERTERDRQKEEERKRREEEEKKKREDEVKREEEGRRQKVEAELKLIEDEHKQRLEELEKKTKKEEEKKRSEHVNNDEELDRLQEEIKQMGEENEKRYEEEKQKIEDDKKRWEEERKLREDEINQMFNDDQEKREGDWRIKESGIGKDFDRIKDGERETIMIKTEEKVENEVTNEDEKYQRHNGTHTETRTTVEVIHIAPMDDEHRSKDDDRHLDPSEVIQIVISDASDTEDDDEVGDRDKEVSLAKDKSRNETSKEDDTDEFQRIMTEIKMRAEKKDEERHLREEEEERQRKEAAKGKKEEEEKKEKEAEERRRAEDEERIKKQAEKDRKKAIKKRKRRSWKDSMASLESESSTTSSSSSSEDETEKKWVSNIDLKGFNAPIADMDDDEEGVTRVVTYRTKTTTTTRVVSWPGAYFFKPIEPGKGQGPLPEEVGVIFSLEEVNPYQGQACCDHLKPVDPAVRTAQECSFHDKLTEDARPLPSWYGDNESILQLYTPFSAIREDDIHRLMDWETEGTRGWKRLKRSRDCEVWSRRSYEGGPPITKAIVKLGGVPYDEAVKLLQDWGTRHHWDKTFDRIDVLEMVDDSSSLLIHCPIKKRDFVLATLNKEEKSEPYFASAWRNTTHPNTRNEKIKPLKLDYLFAGLVVRPQSVDNSSSLVTIICQVKGSVPSQAKGTFLAADPAKWAASLKKFHAQNFKMKAQDEGPQQHGKQQTNIDSL